jgi:dTDP-4-amino-4,6-dideoxygalactose transaminase
MATAIPIPFFDLEASIGATRAEVVRRIEQVIDRGAFAGGPFVEEFEQAFAHYLGYDYVVAVGNGTEALWLSLLALDIGPGDEVITVPNTFIATAEAISFTGARPVFVDVDPHTYTMAPDALEAAITPYTKAIMPVHLYGQPADMTAILEVAGRHGIAVVEDACQAHGARCNNRRVGSLGRAGCFSFYPGKNLGAFGEGGAVVTNETLVAERVRMLRDHGQREKYDHRLLGWNSRMDAFQAVVLSTKLGYLEERNASRRAIAAIYDALLADVPEVVLPEVATYAHHVYHLYVVRVQDREHFVAAMRDLGVLVGIHYPHAIHLQGAYASLGHSPGSFPVAEQCAREVVSLPMFPELGPERALQVAEAVQACVGSAGLLRKPSTVGVH